jgi:hypothetical protein
MFIMMVLKIAFIFVRNNFFATIEIANSNRMATVDPSINSSHTAQTLSSVLQPWHPIAAAKTTAVFWILDDEAYYAYSIRPLPRNKHECHMLYFFTLRRLC